VRYGVLFPQNDIGIDPGAVREFVQGVEGLGFDYLMAYEHVLGANPQRPGWGRGRPYTYRDAFHEPFTLFSYLSAVTERIEFATAVLVLPQRQTALVAKQVAQLDLLSGGRFRFGVGVGWNEVEYAGLGVDFGTRGRRIEEQLEVLRRLWRDPLVTFRGTYHALDDVGINPRPSRRIPLWMGGAADAVLRRMARAADGWFMPGASDERSRDWIETLQGYLREAGRSPAAFGIDRRLVLKDVPESEWAAWLERSKALGATHGAVIPDSGSGDPADWLAQLDRFRRVVAL